MGDGPGAGAASEAAEVGRVFREEFGRSVATLIRVFGDIDIAEDAVQEAFAIALETWPRDGLPPNPGGWITTTARRRAIDRLRRESRGKELIEEATMNAKSTTPEPTDAPAVEDERLRLIFMCCHPALSAEAQVALTLRLLGGLTTEEVARSFLVPETTMAQRLVRAKKKIRLARIPYRVPEEGEIPERLPPALAVVYLIYTAGQPAGSGSELCPEAIRLARVLASLMQDQPEVAGLLALLLLTESRRHSRIAADGSLVLLADQDRTRWDPALIEEGRKTLGRALAQDRLGPYQLQAAIAAVHAAAPSAEQTDWLQIVGIYDQLIAITSNPVVALNRAVALAEVEGAEAGLALIDALELEGYHPFHASRAALLRRLGRDQEAAAAYERAAELAPTEAERAFLSGAASPPSA